MPLYQSVIRFDTSIFGQTGVNLAQESNHIPWNRGVWWDSRLTGDNNAHVPGEAALSENQVIHPYHIMVT